MVFKVLSFSLEYEAEEGREPFFDDAGSAAQGNGFLEYTFELFPDQDWIGARIYHREALSFAYTPSGKSETDYLIGKYQKGIFQNKKTKELEIYQTPNPDRLIGWEQLRDEEQAELEEYRAFRQTNLIA